MQPLVSIIIPTYNRVKFLGQALDSALGQTYDRLEIIVVDDGSTDATRHLVGNYGERVRYLYQDHSERSIARNRGVRASHGEYIAFLDSDDLWLPEKIEHQVAAMNAHTEIDVTYTDVQYVDEDGNPYQRSICWAGLQRIREDLYEDLMTRNVISGSASSILLRRHCLEMTGGFDEGMDACEDLDLWRRLAARFRFYKIDLPLVKLRIHPSNTQGKRSMMARGYETILWKVWHETLDQSSDYKYEAVLRLLAKIALLYQQDRRLRSFFVFCGKSLAVRASWFKTFGFWYGLFRFWQKGLGLNRSECRR